MKVWDPTVAYDARLTALHHVRGRQPVLLGNTLRTADVYAWAPDIAATIRGATASLDLETLTLTPDLFPAPSFWYVDMPPEDPDDPGDKAITYPLLFWRVRPKTLRLVMFNVYLQWPMFAIDIPLGEQLKHFEDQTPESPFGWEVDEPFEGDFIQGLCYTMMSFVVAGTFFLQQRIVDTSPWGASRHARKRAARLNLTIEPNVRVIQLRRVFHDAPATDDHAALRRWSCRWWVSGHWRRLDLPERATRHVWVMPHLKGPDDAPLKLPKARIFSVAR